jgi:hypothetical protein
MDRKDMHLCREFHPAYTAFSLPLPYFSSFLSLTVWSNS